MKNSIVFIILTISIFSCIKQNKELKESTLNEDSIALIYEPEIDSLWIKSDFDSVIAIILNGDRIIFNNLQMMDSMYSFKSRTKLDSLQRSVLLEELKGKKGLYLFKGIPWPSEEDYSSGDCFQPNHGFLLYKNGKIKGRIAICFVCNNYYTLPLNSGKIYLKNIKEIFKQLNFPTYNWDDENELKNAKVTYGDYFKKEKNSPLK